MVVYLFCLKNLVLISCLLTSSRTLGIGLVGILSTCTSLVAGFSIHTEDIPPWCTWIR